MFKKKLSSIKAKIQNFLSIYYLLFIVSYSYFLDDHDVHKDDHDEDHEDHDHDVHEEHDEDHEDHDEDVHEDHDEDDHHHEDHDKDHKDHDEIDDVNGLLNHHVILYGHYEIYRYNKDHGLLNYDVHLIHLNMSDDVNLNLAHDDLGNYHGEINDDHREINDDHGEIHDDHGDDHGQNHWDDVNLIHLNLTLFNSYY